MFFLFLYQMYNDPIHRQIINRMNKNKEFSWKKDYFSSFQELLKVRIEITWLLNRMQYYFKQQTIHSLICTIYMYFYRKE